VILINNKNERTQLKTNLNRALSPQPYSSNYDT